MFCHNCGSVLDNDTVMCPKCGILIKREQYKKITKGNSTNVKGVICLIFGIISILMCINLMLKDISTVGMYTKIIDRLYFCFDFILTPFLLSCITIVLSTVGEDNYKSLNKTGLFLSILSLLFIITEVIIVVTY